MTPRAAVLGGVAFALWATVVAQGHEAGRRLYRGPARTPSPAPGLLAALDDMEARAVALVARPAPECDRVMTEARRFQRGAVVFVKGDHCHVVREGAPRRKHAR